MDETTSTGRAGQVGVHLSIPIYGLQYRLISLVRVGGNADEPQTYIPYSCLRDGFLQRALLTLAFLPPKHQDRWTEKKHLQRLWMSTFVPGMPRPLDVHGRWEYPEAMNFPAPKQCANDFKRLKWGSCNEQRSPFFPCLCVRAGKQLKTQLMHHNSKTSLEIQQIQKDFLRLCDE